MAGRTSGKGRTGPPTPVISENTFSDDEPTLVSVDFRQLVSVLRRRLWLVLGVALLTSAGVAFYLYKQQPRYRANAVIRLVDRRSALTGGLVDPKTTETQQERTTSPLLSQIQVLLSRQVAGLVVDSSEAFGLRLQAPELAPGALRDVHLVPTTTLDSVRLRFTSGMVFAQGWATRPPTPDTKPDTVYAGRAALNKPLTLEGLTLTLVKAPAQEFAVLRVVSRDAAIDELLKNLTAVPRAETDVIDVHYESTDNVAAQRVVNTVVRIFRSLNAQTANLQAGRRREFVENQLAQNDSLVLLAEAAVSEASKARALSAPGRDLTSGEQMALTNLQARQQEMRADAILYRNLLSQLTATKTGNRMEVIRALVASPGLSSNAVVSQLYTQLATFQTEREALTSGPNAAATSNPDVRRLDALIASAENNLVDAIKNYLTSLDARLAAVDTIARGMQPRQISEPEAREEGLVAQLRSLRASGDALRAERQQARIAAAAEVGEVEIVDEATVPTIPIGRSRVLKIALGTLVGMLLGAVFAFIVEALDGLNTSIRRNSEIESLLQLPALGLIPPIDGPPPSRWRSLLRWRKGDQNGSGDGGGLVTLDRAQSPSAEAYRSLRTNLLFSQAVRDLRTLVVTSATPAEGKTTTAANLAATFAQQGVRVLLIDCDLRRPRVHSVMSIPREPGLTQLLLEQSTMDEAVRAGAIPNLFVLPAGRLPPNPSELLGGNRMEALLDRMTGSFDLLLLDSPPVLLTPDSAVLGAICDGVLLVLRAGRTQQQAAREALRQLAAVDAHVVGAVLNDPDSKVPVYDRQYAYGYGADYYSPSATPAGV